MDRVVSIYTVPNLSPEEVIDFLRVLKQNSKSSEDFKLIADKLIGREGLEEVKDEYDRRRDESSS